MQGHWPILPPTTTHTETTTYQVTEEIVDSVASGAVNQAGEDRQDEVDSIRSKHVGSVHHEAQQKQLHVPVCGSVVKSLQNECHPGRDCSNGGR